MREIKILGILILTGIVYLGFNFAIESIAAEPSDIVVEYTFSQPKIEKVGEYDRITIPDREIYLFGRPGEPLLPYKTVKILLPQGRLLQDIIVTGIDETIIEGTYRIEPAQKPVPISKPEEFKWTEPDPLIYASSNPYPEKLYSDWSIQTLRGFKILIFQIYPVRYIPKEGIISYFKRIVVEIKTVSSPEVSIEEKGIYKRKAVKIRGFKFDKDKERVRGVVDNPQEIETYRPK